MKVSLPIRTSNPNNGQTGNSRLAGILKAKRRNLQRGRTLLFLSAKLGIPGHSLVPWPLTVKLTRVAPSRGLDPHDGLGASQKSVIDGVADWLGLKSDRDPRVTWELAQRRGKPGEYAVEVEFHQREARET